MGHRKIKPEAQANLVMRDPLSWHQRLLARLFPSRPGPVGTSELFIVSTTTVHLDWLDRLRVLAGGNVRVVIRTDTDVAVGLTLSTSTAYVTAPGSGDG